jgi:hypothetical protein
MSGSLTYAKSLDYGKAGSSFAARLLAQAWILFTEYYFVLGNPKEHSFTNISVPSLFSQL